MTGSGETRIVLDGRLKSGHPGGVEQVVIGMAYGLSSLEGPERYSFLAYQDSTDWLRPFVSGPCSIVEVPAPQDAPLSWRGRLARALPGGAALKRRMAKPAPDVTATVVPLPVSDGTAERLGAQAIHFLTQNGFKTQIPSIYHPHDLQHRHLPEFFTAADRAQRDSWWGQLCDQAAIVSVTTKWGKADLVEQYGIDPDKIAVVHLAPAVTAYGSPTEEQCQAARRRFGLPSEFALYPAQTWPHKNHIRLIRALSLLRDEGLDVSLVCTGTMNDHYGEIEAAVKEAGLEGRVRFLGFIESSDLQALYGTARCLIMPTLFEAAGGFGPIAEAFQSGLPVACSTATSLPEQVGDAAVTFDPYDVGAIAAALRSLWEDKELRQELAEKGRANVARYSWEKTAKIFRAYHRRLAGLDVSDEDRALSLEPTDY